MATFGVFQPDYVENQEQIVQQDDLKHYEFDQKGNFSKYEAYKDATEKKMGEKFTAEKTGKKKTQVFQRRQQKWCPDYIIRTNMNHLLQPQSVKGERFCFEKNISEHHVPEWCGLQNLFLEIGSRQFSNPGTPPVQPRQKETQLLLQVARDPGILHEVLVLVHVEYKSCGIKKASTEISEKSQKIRKCDPEMGVCVSSNVKSRPQNFGHICNVDDLRKTARIDQNWRNKDAMGVKAPEGPQM